MVKEKDKEKLIKKPDYGMEMDADEIAKLAEMDKKKRLMNLDEIANDNFWANLDEEFPPERLQQSLDDLDVSRIDWEEINEIISRYRFPDDD
jgi:hypothetical protein